MSPAGDHRHRPRRVGALLVCVGRAGPAMACCTSCRPCSRGHLVRTPLSRRALLLGLTARAAISGSRCRDRHALADRPASADMPRGGLLMGFALAVRPPPCPPRRELGRPPDVGPRSPPDPCPRAACEESSDAKHPACPAGPCPSASRAGTSTSKEQPRKRRTLHDGPPRAPNMDGGRLLLAGTLAGSLAP